METFRDEITNDIITSYVRTARAREPWSKGLSILVCQDLIVLLSAVVIADSIEVIITRVASVRGVKSCFWGLQPLEM